MSNNSARFGFACFCVGLLCRSSSKILLLFPYVGLKNEHLGTKPLSYLFFIMLNPSALVH
jgi:hypothetical protein